MHKNMRQFVKHTHSVESGYLQLRLVFLAVISPQRIFTINLHRLQLIPLNIMLKQVLYIKTDSAYKAP